MKRTVFSIIILVLVGALGCLFYFDVLSNVTFIGKIYLNFEIFGLWLINHMDFLASLAPKDFFVIFLAACYVVFELIFLLITGLIAHSKKKKIAAKEEEKKRLENDPTSPLAYAKGFTTPAGQPQYPLYIPSNVKPTASFLATDSVLSEQEKDEEFRWENFVGGRKIARKVIVIIFIVLVLLFALLRFFWMMRDAGGSTGIGFIDQLFKVGFMDKMMSGVDGFFNKFLGNFGPDVTDGSKNVLVKSVMNGQALYTSDLLEFVCYIVAGFLVILFYIWITRGLCYMFRKGPARRRARDARLDYEDDIKENKIPKYHRRTVRGTTYLYNYFINYGNVNTVAGVPGAVASGVAQNVAPVTGHQEVGQNEVGEYSQFPSSSKSEVFMGNIDETGGNIASIAVLDAPIDEHLTIDADKKIEYIEDLGEGVKDVASTTDEEKPYEEYEELYGKSDDVKITSIASLDEKKIANEFDEVSADETNLDSIFEIERGEVEGIETAEKCIDFDEDGFAYSVDEVEQEQIEEDENIIPETVHLDLARDSSPLIENPTEEKVIVEPDFELVEKTPLISPVIIADENSYSSKEEVIIKNVGPNDEPLLSEEQKDLLAKYTPDVTPVEELPVIGEVIGDNGALAINEEYDIVEVAEITELKENKPLPAGLKPIHEIKNRETPKIVPLVVKKEEVVVEEEVVAPTPLKGPLHEINAASRKKDIKPVEVNKDYRFALKRFQTSTYKGNLTPSEAFALGVTKVTPVVNPVTRDAANDSSIPAWMKRVKERNAKQQGITDTKLKQAEELSSVYAVNSKKNEIEKVNEVTLRRRRKPEEPIAPVVEEKKEDEEIKIARPIAPIAVQVKEESVEEKHEDKPAIKLVAPVVPIHKPNGVNKSVKPIKPIKPVKPQK